MAPCTRAALFAWKPSPLRLRAATGGHQRQRRHRQRRYLRRNHQHNFQSRRRHAFSRYRPGECNLVSTSGCPTCTSDVRRHHSVVVGGQPVRKHCRIERGADRNLRQRWYHCLACRHRPEGDLQVTGNLNVNGIGTGSAGKIFLVYNDASNPVFVIRQQVTNSGVTGNITATAPSYGTGGTIAINNISTSCCAALDITLAGTLSASSTSGAPGNVTLNDTTINADLPTCCNGTEQLPVLPVSISESVYVNLQGSGSLNGINAAKAGTAFYINSSNGLSTQTYVSSGASSITLSSSGNITINSALYLPGENLTFVSAQNIITGPGASSINTSGTTGNGGSITMVAGANFTLGNGLSPVCCSASDLTITGPSATGGNIDLYHGTQITTIESYGGGTAGSNGGNVTFVAFAGANGTNGSITLPPSGVIYTGSLANGANGNVLMIAGATSGTGISTGIINTAYAGSPGTGTIALYTAQPAVSGGAGGSSGVAIDNGIITSGSFVPGTAAASSITASGACATNAAPITVDFRRQFNIQHDQHQSYVYSFRGSPRGLCEPDCRRLNYCFHDNHLSLWRLFQSWQYLYNCRNREAQVQLPQPELTAQAVLPAGWPFCRRPGRSAPAPSTTLAESLWLSRIQHQSCRYLYAGFCKRWRCLFIQHHRKPQHFIQRHQYVSDWSRRHIRQCVPERTKRHNFSFRRNKYI